MARSIVGPRPLISTWESPTLSSADVAEINEFLGCTATAGTRWDEGRQQYECMDGGEWFDTWLQAMEHFTPEWLFQYQLEVPTPSTDTAPDRGRDPVSIRYWWPGFGVHGTPRPHAQRR